MARNFLFLNVLDIFHYLSLHSLQYTFIILSKTRFFVTPNIRNSAHIEMAALALHTFYYMILVI